MLNLVPGVVNSSTKQGSGNTGVGQNDGWAQQALDTVERNSAALNVKNPARLVAGTGKDRGDGDVLELVAGTSFRVSQIRAPSVYRAVRDYCFTSTAVIQRKSLRTARTRNFTFNAPVTVRRPITPPCGPHGVQYTYRLPLPVVHTSSNTRPTRAQHGTPALVPTRSLTFSVTRLSRRFGFLQKRRAETRALRFVQRRAAVNARRD